ncbi:MAG: hypothetical protein Kow00122_09910 [Thermoleophilia bacterium]
MTTAEHTESCRLCGRPLEYRDTAADLTCAVCGRTGRGHIVCPAGHYVCEACHGAGFLARLPELLAASTDTSPHALAEALMAQADLPMLGCEHAHLAAGALMTALRNRGDLGVTEAHVTEVLERTARQAISAYCGLSGVCGVVPALGACYSVLVGAQCGRGPQTRAVMSLVSRLAAALAEEADPGCCKAYVRRALLVTAATLATDLGVTLPAPDPITCVDGPRHPHGCRGPACSWHPEHAAASEPAPAPPAADTPTFVAAAVTEQAGGG